MSHTLNLLNTDQVQLVSLTVVNYATGGEAVTAAEVRGSGVDGLVLATVPPGQNSLGVPLFPVLSAGKILLYQFVGGSPTEIPPTTALNANIFALVHLTGCAA